MDFYDIDFEDEVLDAIDAMNFRECTPIQEKTFPQMAGKVEIYNIGTVIGSHTGPGTIALFFWGNKKD